MAKMWEELLPKIVGETGTYVEEGKSCYARLTDFKILQEDTETEKAGGVILHFKNLGDSKEFNDEWKWFSARSYIGVGSYGGKLQLMSLFGNSFTLEK